MLAKILKAVKEIDSDKVRVLFSDSGMINGIVEFRKSETKCYKAGILKSGKFSKHVGKAIEYELEYADSFKVEAAE